MAKRTQPKQPAIYDSDLILLAINRLQRVADKMQRFEYDDELERHMERAVEVFDWVAWNITNRRTREDSNPDDREETDR